MSLVKPLQGLVNGGGSRAVVGARVYVLQANNTGDGNPSVPLLTAATGNPNDSIGHYVITGEYGGFSIAGDYTCTTGQQVYLYVRGGDSGGNGANSAIGLMASLGVCPEAGTFTSAEPFVIVNAVTTVAAAYELAGSAVDPSHVSRFHGSVVAMGIGKAYNLARVATGATNAMLPSDPSARIPQSKINTLANILSACINTDSPNSTNCKTLFANAPGNDVTKTIPDDTASAAINIAHNPRANVSNLYSLQHEPDAPFRPYLGSIPDDFTIIPKSENSDTAFAASHP